MICDIIENIKPIKIVGSTNFNVEGISINSKEINKGDMFVAIKGTVTDGHKYIPMAINSGAIAILCSVLPTQIYEGVCYIVVEDSAKCLPIVAKSFYGNPTSKFKLVGVTGTNGKTSTTTLLYNLFTNLGYKCGLVSTINYTIAGKEMSSSHTTPDAIKLNKMFAEMVEVGCDYCFMEVSSHAISQHRIDGLEFDVVLFTNITHDHLDYHKTFDNYIKTKKQLFDNLSKSSVSLYNADDKNGAVMVQNSNSIVKSFSLRRATDYRCRVIEKHLDAMLLEIDKQELWVNLIGEFNAYNLLGVYAIAVELGVESQDVLTQISKLSSVRGRFEVIKLNNNSIAVVDYAHTPDALQNVLQTLCESDHKGKLITIVGCGGDRDKTKRPIMASIAVKNSDFVILTSDNPRTEEPDAILKDMLEGVKDEVASKYITISSRADAIKMGVLLANQATNSILLVAGKGHETYQEINGERFDFDDKKVIIKNL